MKPLVSVIIPTYRRTTPLKEALASVCTQVYPCVEIVVIDDNADPEWNEKICCITDEARRMLQKNHTLSLLVNETNLGAAQSRNVGIYAAHGAYITFLDDDDIYLPGKISTQLEAMVASSADYSLMDLKLINEEGKTVEHKKHPYVKGVTPPEELLRLHLRHHLTGTDTMMFRRDYLLEIGCFGNIDIGDEFYLMMNAIEHKGRFLYIPATLVRATVHYDGSGLSGGPLKFEGENLLFRFKQKYFYRLSAEDVRYIKMRHHAVLAFAHLKVRAFVPFLKESFISLMLSPVECIRMIYQRHNR